MVRAAQLGMPRFHAPSMNSLLPTSLISENVMGSSENEGTSQIEVQEHYMQLALSEARKSPPKPTNFCVGACLVAASDVGMQVLATGYTLECEGNTHAEQCCFIKMARQYNCSDDSIGQHLQPGTVLYTTMEPCNKRSVGNLPCVDRILRLKNDDGKPAIKKVYVGVTEPETFVGENNGKGRLEGAGIEIVHVSGFEGEILEVATAGHPKEGEKKGD